MKRLYLCTMLMLGLTGAWAQNSMPSYAVVSLIGDQLTVAVYTGQTGTNLQPTRKLLEATKSTAFDDAAVTAAGDAIKQVNPSANISLLSTKNPDLYKAQEHLLDSGDTTARKALTELLKESPVDYVVVLTKYQSNAKFDFPMQNKFGGDGRVEGIGYYVDNKKRVQAVSDGGGKGFLATFAYVNAVLIDAKSLKVLGQQFSTKSDLTINTVATIDSFTLLTPEQKADALQKVVRAAAQDSVTKLLQGVAHPK